VSDDDLEDLMYVLETGKDVRYVDPATGLFHRIYALRSHWWFLGRDEEEAAVQVEGGKWLHLRNTGREDFWIVVPALPKSDS
jgi:hypothetical protein